MPLVANIGIESEIIGKHTLSYYLIATYAWLHSLKLIDFYIIAKLYIFLHKIVAWVLLRCISYIRLVIFA